MHEEERIDKEIEEINRHNEEEDRKGREAEKRGEVYQPQYKYFPVFTDGAQSKLKIKQIKKDGKKTTKTQTLKAGDKISKNEIRIKNDSGKDMTLEYQLKPKETSSVTIKKKTWMSFTKGTNETFKVIKTGEKK